MTVRAGPLEWGFRVGAGLGEGGGRVGEGGAFMGLRVTIPTTHQLMVEMHQFGACQPSRTPTYKKRKIIFNKYQCCSMIFSFWILYFGPWLFTFAADLVSSIIPPFTCYFLPARITLIGCPDCWPAYKNWNNGVSGVDGSSLTETFTLPFSVFYAFWVRALILGFHFASDGLHFVSECERTSFCFSQHYYGDMSWKIVHEINFNHLASGRRCAAWVHLDWSMLACRHFQAPRLRRTEGKWHQCSPGHKSACKHAFVISCPIRLSGLSLALTNLTRLTYLCRFPTTGWMPSWFMIHTRVSQ